MRKLNQIGKDLNAFRVHFDNALLDEIRESYQSDLASMLAHPANHYILKGGRPFVGPVTSCGSNYFVITYGVHPLLWFSSNNDSTYQIYKRFLDALDIEDDIKKLVDHNEKILLYCGFLVVGDRAPNEVWHVDYDPGANAYTLITPLFELAPGHGNLLYRGGQYQVETYTYNPGEALVFGDKFMHTTETYEPSNRLRVLVSLQFGTDKIEHWDVLRKTIESQSNYLMLPCGHILGACQCAKREGG